MSGQRPERRLNLLTGDWVLVSPQRLQRPWQGDVGPPAAPPGPSYDPTCYLCPGNARAGGARNPPYTGVFVFDNDYPALLPPESRAGAAPAAAGAPGGPEAQDDELLVRRAETGLCRVICYTPDHSRTMARMSAEEIAAVVRAWRDETRTLQGRGDVAAVTIFENRGEMMGASNPHPHGQIWATSSVPNELARECARSRAHAQAHGAPLLADYLARELAARERVVLEGAAFVVLVPFWAAWPFETLILPRRPIGALEEADAAEILDLASVLGRLTRAFDRVFDAPFPYTLGVHQRPATEPAGAFVLHLHVYPPLLRSATIRKFMVGFEMLGMPQRDLTAEAAAERLREAARAAGV